MEKKVKFGVVGVGSRGLGAFSTMICQRTDAEVAAFCDTNEIRMKTAAEKLKINPNFYATITDMVKNESLDAVVITTPDFYHEQCAVEALENGVNVLIDKPLATSVKGCRNIIAAAEKAGKTVMLGFNLRHNAVLKKVKKLISENTIGKVFLIENREFYDGGRTYMSRWNRSYEFCGGLWIHKGSHDFDVFQWLLDFPKPVKVSSFAGINVLNKDHIPFEVTPGTPVGPTCHECPYKKICPDIYDISGELDRWGDEAAKLDGYKKDLCIYTSDKSVHDNGTAIVEYDNGARAIHTECFIGPVHDRKYTIWGELATIEVSLTNQKIIVYPRWSKDTLTYDIVPAEGGHGGADPLLLESFVTAVKRGDASGSTAEHGMWSTACGEAAELSWREHRMVEVKELFD